MVDVVVLGTGSAGAAAAALCAGRGLSVVALERGALAEAGAQWCNAVPGWCFDDSGVPRPTAPEARGASSVHLIAGWGPERVFVSGQDVLEVDMRQLTARLQTMARDAGADLRPHTEALGLEDDVVRTTSGPVRARWVVDATGLHGASFLPQPRVHRRDLCVARQEVRQVVDPARARAWFRQHGASPDEILCFTGVAGGYSIVNVRLHGDDEVAILTGSMPGHGHASGVVLLDRFVAEHTAWIGETRFGGARPIPIRSPYGKLHHGRVAFLGDAAAQVFAAHGSGVGAQLVGARLLADTLADGGTVADYSRRWWGTYGGELAASAVFQAFSRDLTADTLGRLMRAGLMVPPLVRATMEQRPPPIDAAVVRDLARGMLRDPEIVAKVLPVLGRMTAARVGARLRGAIRPA